MKFGIAFANVGPFGIPDPILPLASAAARSQRLRLGTGVLILPQV